MTNLSFKQQGNFSVEFAIVGVFFALLLVFSGDIVSKISIKGKLERMAFSAVSIIKERTELFGEDVFDVTNEQAEKAYHIVQSSLHRTVGDFADDRFRFVLHVRRGNSVRQWISPGRIVCDVSTPDKNLNFMTTYGRDATLYQVALCYDTNNWFGDLIGEQFRMVSTKAIMMGR